MTRKEIYAKVKALNLEESIKKDLGKNFTQVSNDLLLKAIEVAESKKPKKINIKDKIKKENKVTLSNIIQNVKRENPLLLKEINALDRLLKILQSKHILLESEVKSILYGNN